MTGPEGDQSRGWWKVVAVEPPHHLEVEDGFADASGAPNPNLPTTNMRVDISATRSGSQMLITSTFPSREAMEQMVSMGMEEGIQQALGQIDGILADLAAKP
jgi:uncharacterized protein YndB with AHSA1/START domain